MQNRFVIKSEISQLAIVHNWLKEQIESLVDKSILNNVLLITQEMVANSIVHGNQEDINKNVTLTLDVTADHIAVMIEDEGEGIKNLPSKEEAKELDYLAENGRGLKLAVLLCEEIVLKGNQMTLVFNKNAT